MKYKVTEVKSAKQTAKGTTFFRVVLEDENKEKFDAYVFGKRINLGDELEGELVEVKKDDKSWLKFVEEKRGNKIWEMLYKIYKDVELIKAHLLDQDNGTNS